MPIYSYQSVSNPERVYDLMQQMDDQPYTHHPESGEAIRKIFTTAPAIHQRGLKRSTRVDKSSPAATACACASNAALEVVGMGKQTPRYQPKSNLGHSHRQSMPSGESKSHHHHSHSGPCHGHHH